MKIQKRAVKRINPKEKSIQEKMDVVKKKINQPEHITNPLKIKKINLIFEETRLKINQLREIKDPVKETRLRHKLFSEFEKQLKEQGAVVSYQKTKTGGKSLTEQFSKLIARDFYNHTTKQLTTDKMANLIQIANAKLKNNHHSNIKTQEYIERCYYESMYFIQGDILEHSCKLIEQRLSDIPPEIKTTVTSFLIKEYLEGYDKQIKEYISKRKIESDIVTNAYSNLAIKVSFLEML